MTINRDQLCVGDVVKIEAGMGIPVDGIVLKASGV
jgi:cation transport ATPase